jgi:23S rRNA pseudouridine2605 synthase
MPNNTRRPPAAPSRPPRPAAAGRRRSPDAPAAAEGARSQPRTTTGETSRRSRHQEPAGKPERLHKLLANSGIGSRREMEALIAAGRINVNGETAQVGQTVSPGDRIKVNGKLVQLRFSDRLPRVILYHKPEGEIVSRNDPDHRRTSSPRCPGCRPDAGWRSAVSTSIPAACSC